MPKVLEESLGNLEYLMAALTLLGVLYLCYKQSDLRIKVSYAAARGAAAGSGNRQGFEVDAHTMRFLGGQRSHPGARSGFAGSLNNGPEFWANSTEMDQLAGIANDQDNVDDVNEMSFHDVANRNLMQAPGASRPVNWTTEGMYRVPRRAGFNNEIAKALRGL